MTFKEGDDGTGFTTTLTIKNCHTNSAGTKNHECDSQIEKMSNGMCMQGADGKRTYRGIVKLHDCVMILIQSQ